ncbi:MULTISPECIES: TonB-dependent receptor domain-containing protein [Campylobacter]|uniref:TonB-dependent receptor domain-containing protein n=2 Tax=Campylobacter TaxID=194 RepID=UPI000A350996|nr:MULTISPECIES: TonB-dependent receptor [unclassified Campylobacter]MCR8696256.1 TonB-dependent receptor [Campylobacter sp. RM19073]
MRMLCALCAAVSLYAQDVNLGRVNVTQSYEKNILDNPTTTQITKDTILNSPDLAKSLLDISGFNMVRKGGGGSEVSYRSGLSARLPIYIDGSEIQGGCGGRMDTAITYIEPQNYRSIKIIKGPQDVRYGALVNGGLVFDRGIIRLDNASYGADISMLAGSFNQKELSGEAIGGNELGSIQINGGIYQSDNYKDGDGNIVHSEYFRKQGAIIGTITPNDESAISLSADFGNGEAAYADRAMDGTKFQRESYNLALEQVLGKHTLNLQGYYHYIDHVMDNFSLRPAMPNRYNISNPKREIIGTKAEIKLNFDDITTYIGGSYKEDKHSSRMAQNATSATDAQNRVFSQNYNKNALISTTSIFTQSEYFSENYGIFGGLRIDRVEIDKYNIGIFDRSKMQTPISGFMRYERYYDALSLYAGVGRAERTSDFWEFQKIDGMNLKTEKNHQIDLGALYDDGNINLSTNLFLSKIDDYIVLNYGTTTSAFNTDALLMGGEMDMEILIDNFYKLGAGLSYVYGKNLKNTNGLKDGDPLPQISPLAFKAVAGLVRNEWFVDLDFYANASQHRYKENYGNVAGKDLGYSDSFWTIGLNAGYKYNNYQVMLAAMNLNNALYSYHTSKNGAAIATLDIPATTRVYEPGRSFWIKLKASF